MQRVFDRFWRLPLGARWVTFCLGYFLLVGPFLWLVGESLTPFLALNGPIQGLLITRRRRDPAKHKSLPPLAYQPSLLERHRPDYFD